MPKLCAVSTRVPPFRMEQGAAKELASRLFAGRLSGFERLLPVFDHSGIQTRYFSVTWDWFTEDHSLEEKNRIYIATATELGASAADDVLQSTDTARDDIDCIMYVNTTGLATPSIDARLVNHLGLQRDIRRVPIWGLGCAGGAAGLSRAYDYLVGHPDHRVLVVAVELCGLTFIHNDYSKSNFVASALFGEGAAAALLCGDDVSSDGPEVLTARSTFYPDSLDVMGWNIVSRGMQVVFDRRIPDIVAANAAADLDEFLNANGLCRGDIKRYLFHPGGLKVLEAYQSAFGVNGPAFELSWETLRSYGNMSSVTVLFVVDRFLRQVRPTESGHAVISALGPGFCSESLLISY